MNASALESEFESRAVRYAGGLLLLVASDAIELIDRARSERIPVLGVDGLKVGENETVSPLEHIADYSSLVRRGDGCWDAARAFITSRDGLGLVFEVVLGEPLEPAV